MPNFYVTRLGIVVPALAGLGIVAAAAGSGDSVKAPGSLTCEIEVKLIVARYGRLDRIIEAPVAPDGLVKLGRLDA